MGSAIAQRLRIDTLAWTLGRNLAVAKVFVASGKSPVAVVPRLIIQNYVELQSCGAQLLLLYSSI
jgi:hypothetical protein